MIPGIVKLYMPQGANNVITTVFVAEGAARVEKHLGVRKLLIVELHIVCFRL